MNALLLIALLHQAPLDKDAAAVEAERLRLRDLLDRGASFVEILPDTAATVSLPAVPVHRWTNNERDPHGQGLLVLWHHRGRPVATASVFPWTGKLVHELESLSRGPFVCRRDELPIWQPQHGIPFAPVPDAEPPAETPGARLRQMKTLADQFSVTMLGWRADNADREELRRLPKEFFRYKPEQPDVLDGAVFGFVKGTDPEALLLLEAVKAPSGLRYEFAFVRQTSGGLEGRHRDRPVWTAQKHAPRKDPTQTSFSSGVPLTEAYRRLDALPKITLPPQP
jgi:hypothetical protein